MNVNVSNSDVKRRAEAAALVSAHYGLVPYVVFREIWYGEQAEELIQVASLGLVKAAWTYQPDRGTAFSTYAVTCIQNEIWMERRKSRRWRREIGVEKEDLEWISLHSAEDMDERYGLADPEQDYIGTASRESLQRAMGKLNCSERELIRRRYGLDGKDCCTQKEAAEMWHVSQSYFSRMERKVLSKLREEMEK